MSVPPVTLHLLLFGGGGAVAVGSLAWTARNWDKHAAPEFGVFLCTVVLWAGAQSVEVLGGRPVAYGASFAVEALRAVMAVSWFYFTMTYAGYGTVVHSTTVRAVVGGCAAYLVAATAVPPVATALTFETVRVTTTPFTAVVLGGNTSYHILAQVVGYLLVGAGTVALVHRLIRTEYTRARQTILFVAAVSTVILFDALLDQFIAPVDGVDYTVIGTSAVSAVYILTLYRGDLFGFAPVARDHVFHNIDDAVVVLNPAHSIIDVNEAAESMFGDDVTIGADADAVLPEAVVADDRVQNLTDGRTTVSFGTDEPTRHYDMTVSTLSAASSAATGVAVILRETTERVTHRRELERVRGRMKFALNAIDAAVWDWNPDDDRVSFYPSAVTLYGTSVDTRQDFMEMVHPDDRQQVQDALRDSLERGEPTAEEVRVVRDGELRWIQASGKPVERDDQTRLIGVVRDVTERKQNELELNRQNERLDRFASVVSHDLRNPLNVAAGRLELARADCDSDHLDDVEQALDRMEALVTELLALARQGESVDEPETVGLTGTVERCWETVETTPGALDAQTDQTIRADPTRLRQLLTNLFRNAVEHGDGDVTVTVGALDGADGFYVADDGPGIPPDERDDVFEAGYSTAEDGTGFGLNIVREIAEAHGWTVTVTDSETGGARFEIAGVDVVRP